MAGRGWLRVGLLCAGLLVVGGGVWFLVGTDEGDGDRGAQSPTSAMAPIGRCPYVPIDAEKYGRTPLKNPPEERSVNGTLDTTVTVEYTDPNEVSIGGCGLHVRSYNGNLFGSTLRLNPGDQLNLTLDNRLPKQSPQEIEKEFKQQAKVAHIAHTPNAYNTTNVHYHGLHVSPRGNSDNVLLALEPQTTFDYEVDLPDDHPPGTYWYHAHAHGSTAIQVASGMAGPLIVEDDPREIPPALRAANKREKVMLFQSILYDTDGEVEHMKSFFPPPGNKDDPNFDPNCQKGRPTCTWGDSHRRTTINGQIEPVIEMRPGEVQRWRLIDGTFRESLFLQLEGHSLHEIALDGNYLGWVDTWDSKQTVHLEAGYRSDVLVKANMNPGTYKLVDTGTPPDKTIRGKPEDKTVLAHVVVKGTPVDMELPTDAEMAPLAPFGDLDLSKQAEGVQEMAFKLGSDWKGSARNYFQVNGAAFSPDNVRTLFLNDVDVWRLGTVGDPPEIPIPASKQIPPISHLFHIHVNPFQLTRTDPDGNQELVWKDTLLIEGDPVDVYTQYKDFTGEFVIHCHILDHEDLGMMEAVKVVKESQLNPESTHH